MTLRSLLASMIVAVSLAAASAGPRAQAVLKSAGGDTIGNAVFTEVAGGVEVQVITAGLAPGQHGIHIHAAGRCDAPEFKTAGGHFNPTGKQHGMHNPAGAHAGDLPNLSVREDGKGTATFTARGATLGDGAGSLLSGDGTALVIHADPDDEKTDPAGNSGARIACGVVQKG